MHDLAYRMRVQNATLVLREKSCSNCVAHGGLQSSRDVELLAM